MHLAHVRHDPELETGLYRIVQEAVNNAVRHAEAQRIEIAVTEADGVILARVSDDGRGFDPATTGDGLGIIGMRERVSLLHGELELASSPLGTTLTVALPGG